MTPEEISILQALNANYQQIFSELGKLEIKTKVIESDKNILIKGYNDLVLKQKEILDKIKEKYGTVKINLDTWEIEEK